MLGNFFLKKTIHWYDTWYGIGRCIVYTIRYVEVISCLNIKIADSRHQIEKKMLKRQRPLSFLYGFKWHLLPLQYLLVWSEVPNYSE